MKISLIMIFLFKNYTFKQKIYSHLVVEMNQQKSGQKSIRYRNIILSIVLLKELENIFAG